MLHYGADGSKAENVGRIEKPFLNLNALHVFSPKREHLEITANGIKIKNLRLHQNEGSHDME
jgi:hypothetical protein